MQPGEPYRSPEQREWLLEQVAAALIRRGWAVSFDSAYVFVGHVRMALDAFEDDFDNALRTFLFKLNARGAGALDGRWNPIIPQTRIGLPGWEYDLSGRHVSEKSG
jgi:hypothetical protein